MTFLFDNPGGLFYTERMSSSFTKTLKQPDGFVTGTQGFFESLTKNTSVMVSIGVGVLVVAGAIGFSLSHSEKLSSEAKDALFQANKLEQADLKALDASLNPAPKEAPKAKQPAKAAETKKLSADFAKVDVDAKFGDAIKAYQGVIDKYGKTRAGYEARLAIGNLFYNHGDASKAINWFEQAAQNAPDGLERAISTGSLGYAQEASGKAADAVQSYEKALALAGNENPGLRGDLMMATARVHQSMGDAAKAKQDYELVTRELPNTEYAKTAELYKAKL